MRRWVDVSRYQAERPDPLDLVKVKQAGYSIVNVALTGGRGYVSGPWAGSYIAAARLLDLGVSCYHWLDGRTSGKEQATRQLARMKTLFGGLSGFAHCVDIEETGEYGITPPEWSHVYAYVNEVQDKLGRPVVIYTGDWWWKPRGWPGASLTPYLMGMPNRGSLPTYPGDDSAHWTAGFGGWTTYSILQHTVGPLPGGKIDVSQSAIRDDRVWNILSQETANMTINPPQLAAARLFFMNTLRSAGVDVNPLSFGTVGDTGHAAKGNSYHLGKSSLISNSYSVVESSRDKNGLSEATSAFDIGSFQFTAKGKTHNLRSFSKWLVAQCEAGTADTADIREVIYSPDGQTVWRWDRLQIRSTGDNSHLTHTHVSWHRDSEHRDKTALFRRYFTEIGLLEGPEDDMPTTDEIGAEVAQQLATFFNRGQQSDGTPTSRIGQDAGNQGVPNPFSGGRSNAYGVWRDTAACVMRLEALCTQILANVVADDGDLANIKAALKAEADSIRGQLDRIEAEMSDDTPAGP